MTQTIVPKGEFVKLKSTANLSTGGTAEDVTDQYIHIIYLWRNAFLR